MSTYGEVLKRGRERLLKAGVPDAAYDAWSLFEFVFDIEKSYYFLHENDKIEHMEQEQRYDQLIGERANRVPLQQIVGRAWFMGYPFYVNEHVLTPRYDTEIVVEAAGKLLRPGMRILDMCTGSGCILLSLMALHSEMKLEGIGVDISPEALAVARKNAALLKVEAAFLESDLFSKVTGTFDLIISNPPYIPTKQIGELMREVRDHEPWLALDGKEDGLYFYEKLSGQARFYLKEGGWLCFEIGYDQRAAVSRMLEDRGYVNIRTGKDLAGLDRFVLAQNPAILETMGE